MWLIYRAVQCLCDPGLEAVGWCFAVGLNAITGMSIPSVAYHHSKLVVMRDQFTNLTVAQKIIYKTAVRWSSSRFDTLQH